MITKKNVPPCFTGLIWTLNAILDLYDSEKSELLFTSPSKIFFLMILLKTYFQYFVKKVVTVKTQLVVLYDVVLRVFVLIWIIKLCFEKI